MKQIIWYLGSLTVFFAASFFFLLNSSTEEFRPDANRYICIASEGAHYWYEIRNGMFEADEDLGCYTKWVEFERYNVEEQIEELEKLKYFDIDGLITVGTPSSDELNEKLKEISESGIPVVLVDTDAKESGRDAYVGTDNYRAGRLAAQMIAEEMNGEGDCLIILTKVENANQAERYDGFAEGLKDQGMALGAYLEMTGDKLALQEGLEKALEENPAIRGIFCAESSSSRRLWPILQQMGREDLTVIGFDNANATLQFVRNGSYAGTIVQSAREIGYESIRFLEDYKEGGEQKTIYTPAVYLTAETIEEE